MRYVFTLHLLNICHLIQPKHITSVRTSRNSIIWNILSISCYFGVSVHKKNKGIHHDVTQWFVQSGVWTLKLIIMAVAMLAFWNSTSQSQSDCESEGHCTLLSNTRKKKEIKYTVFFIFLFDINGNITRKTNKMLNLTWPKTSNSVRNKPINPTVMCLRTAQIKCGKGSPSPNTR